MNSQDQPSDQSHEQPDFQPGKTVSLNQAADSAAPSLPAPAVSQPQPSVPAVVQPQERALYQTDDAQPSQPVTPIDPQMQENGREIVWTAAEFIEHQKSPGWYLGMIGVALVVVVTVFLLTRDIFNTIMCIVAAILFAVVAGRPPRQLQYAIDDHGIQIGRRFYPYSDFRSFSVVDEGAISSIVIMPLKRFMPSLSLYYDLDDEDVIGDLLADHLPYAQHQHELTERLMRRIRF
jgi:hypothetical protein